jgi:alpha-1,6-mannosyltransferase
VAGLLGTVMVSVAASLPGSPFAFKVPGAWFFGVPPLSHGGGVAHASGFTLLFELAGGFVGMVLLCRAWLTICRTVAREPEDRPGWLAAILAAWSVPLLIAPPMFSNDVYSYAAQGEMISHHISPYLYGPDILGASPFSALAQGVWINTPSPYGPLFSGIEGNIVQLSGHRVLFSIVLLRLMAVVGVALIAVFVPRLARSYGREPSLAFSLSALNPLVLLFLVGSGHNDALMVGLLVAGLSLARRGHFVWGVVVCALAGAVKAPGLIGVFAIAWTAQGADSLWRRGLALAKAGVIAATTFELLSHFFGLGWGWVRTLGAADAVTTWITPADLIAKIVPTVSHVTHVHVATVSFLDVAHVAGPAVALAISLWALARLPTIGLPRVMGLSLLAVVLLGPTVQPWYLTWPITILAITAGLRTTTAIRILSVVACVVGAVGLGQLTSELSSLGLLYQVLFALSLATAVVVPMRGAADATRPSPVLRDVERWRPERVWGIRRA